MKLVKTTLVMTLLAILVCVSLFIGIAVTYEGNGTVMENGETEVPKINVEVSTAVIPDANGKVPEGGVSLDGGAASAIIPEGVQLADGATEVALSVKDMETVTEVELEPDEVARSIDVHIEGVAEDNEVPMLVSVEKLFSANLNSTSVKIFHVEDGAPVEMTLVNTPVNHNEFSYDSATGDVVMSVASFSEYVTVENNKNPWEGKAVTDWYNDTDTAFTLTTAEQLAGLGVLVDGGNDFAGKIINLGADIDLDGKDESGNRLSFNPIGFKYPGAKDEAGNDISKIFRGTFDGQNYTIKNLYQNGWDLGLSYSNAGGGLFAGVQNATFRNLTMQGADIVMEAVPMGTVAAYAYGTCTFDNIRITDSTLQNYNWNIGGIVGGVNGNHTFSNIYVTNSVTLSELWGSFDGGIGGIVGDVYGGNNGTNVITMKNIEVACVMDVYNDVTSAYQWYAYRGAGMLIGNTDEPGADGKNAYTAQASFLTCTNVNVYYGDWVNYHYCQFTNQDTEWCNNYPWVRVEEGLSNLAYSNARYGQPVIGGTAISSADHTHKEGDDCNLLITFNQLYGGGQGVYGQATHDGVEVVNYKYIVTYINNSIVLDTIYVTENMLNADGTFNTANDDAANKVAEEMGSGYEFSHWMNAGSTKIETVPADNTSNITLYPSFVGVYTATFVDQDGNVIDWGTFTENNYDDVKNKVVTPPVIEDCEFDYWQVRVNKNGNITTTKLSEYNFADNVDVTIYPIYKYSGSLGVTGVDEDGDGDYEYYQVNAVDQLDSEVVIPGYVNGLPVKVVTDLTSSNWADNVTSIEVQEGVETIESGAFADTPGLQKVSLPSTLTYLGESAFMNSGLIGGIGGLVNYKHPEIIYNGTKADWDALIANSHENWDNNLGAGTKIICEDGTYTYTDNGDWTKTWVWTPNSTT